MKQNILLALGLFFTLMSCSDISGIPKDTNRNQELEQDTSINNGINPYFDLKKLAYYFEYSKLNLPDPYDKEILYGVIMDWDFEGKAVVTLVSFITGDASIYFSSGASIIGGGQHRDINNKSKEFINLATQYLPKATVNSDSIRTEIGYVKFYLLTNKAKYILLDKVENINDKKSELYPLFIEANDLITEIRIKEESRI